jgi:hypothetical protein
MGSKSSDQDPDEILNHNHQMLTEVHRGRLELILLFSFGI